MLREGNVFTALCDSVHMREASGACGCTLPTRQVDIPRQTDTPPCRADTSPLSGRRHARQGTANKAGGTHPTGMYSYLYVLVQLYVRLLSNLSHVNAFAKMFES